MKNRLILRALSVLILSFILGLGLKGLFRGFEPPTAGRKPRAAKAVSQVGIAPEPNAPGQVATGDSPSEISSSSTKFFTTADSFWEQPIPEEPFARFHDWAEQYLHARNADKSALEPEGLDLVSARRQALAKLIESNPERALELSVPVRVRQALPDSVAGLLEKRISGAGRLTVLGALAEPGKENQVVPTFRTASLGGRKYKAFVYGRRLGEPTRENIPIHGIAVDDVLAVRETPLRILEPAEAAKAKAQVSDPICAISGRSANINNDELAADTGGAIVFLCGHIHAQDLNARLIVAESGGPGTSPDGQQPPEASAWTEGQKKLILIRVDFPDLAGQPFADSTGITLISNLNFFYTEMSYGRAGFLTNGAGSDLTPTFRMPQPAGWYGTNDYYDQLRSDARNAATAAGYVLSSYDRDVICMGAVPGFNWSGLAYVGAAGAWLHNSFSTGVAGHELGHNWGLNHANYWDTSSQSVIGPGTSVEYGDINDTMGSASAGNNHFNARYKAYLNWLTTNDWLTVTNNGTYRIFAHDNQNSYGLRALRVVKNSNTNYWVELRQKFTGNKWLMSGAGLRWAQNGNQRSQLLDTTPGSTDGKNDSCIVIGRTFSDKETGIHITPIGKGGTSPESLDVVVNLGFFASDQPPVLALSASATNTIAGATLTFTANATDPEGDALAYYWDFGDGNFGPNSSAVSKSWSSTADYVVRCVVSDMKGQVASASVIVTVGTPTTYRISGTVSTTNGPVQGVRVYVSTTRMAYTDTDGNYTIVGLPAGTYTVGATLENFVLTSSGFANPVSVGPNATEIDFAASNLSYTPPMISAQPLSQTVNPGANVSLVLGASGTSPLRYQWRFNGANINGATSSSYSKSNVQLSDAGNYSTVVSNVAGTATSVNAVLSINTPPSITTPPSNLTVIAGTNAAFTVVAAGSNPLYYQWRCNGTNLASATTSSLTRPNVQSSDAGTYHVVITNIVGSITSAPATLAVNYSLTVNSSYGGTVVKTPDLSSYPPASTVSLMATPISVFPFTGWSGEASGTNTPLTVVMDANKVITANFTSPVPDLIVDNPAAVFTGTWTTDTAATDKYGPDYRYTGTSPNNATAAATFVPDINTAGLYDLYVWYPFISKASPNAQFLIADSSGSATNYINESSGTGVWQLLASSRNFDRGTNGFVRLTNLGPGGKSVVADAVRWVYSQNQNGTPPIITVQPQSQAISAGQTAAFSVTATGTLPLSCQWFFNGSPLADGTNSLLAIAGVGPVNAGDYTITISNSAGSITSLVAVLTVDLPPVLSLQPQAQRVIEGSSAIFSVAADGTPPLFYQWRLNAIPLSGQTDVALVVPAVHLADAGDYEVTVSNMVSTVTSLPATLVISLRPTLSVPTVLTNAQPLLSVTGTPGDEYAIEFSTNLLNWTAGVTISNLTGTVQFTDIDSTNHFQRFYRCRLLP